MRTRKHFQRTSRCLRLAQKGIEELNGKYREAASAMRSFCFIARADGMPRERVWMGYERKRGKLADLNALLREAAHAIASHSSSVRRLCCRP